MMKMRVLLLLFISFSLTACVEGTQMPADIVALNARATLAVVTQQALETRSASIEATRQALVQSAKFEAEAALISTQAAIRQQDLEAQLTQQALVNNRSTAEAAPVLATQSAIQTQPALDATATMIAVGATIAMEGERRAKIMTWAYPIGWLMLCLSLSISLWNVASWAIQKQERKSRVMETRSGTIVLAYDPRTQEYTWTKIESRTVRGLETGYSQIEEAPVATLSSGGILAVSPIDSDAVHVRKDVVKLLKKAQEVNGETAVNLPGHREMGWTSGKWQFIVGIMRSNGLAVTEPSKGTYVAERHGNVDNILYELDTGEIKLNLRPSPGYRPKAE